MGIIVNCLSLMLSALLLVYGISFYLKNRGTSRRINFYILTYCLLSAVWCMSFGSIGLAVDFNNAEILRKIGDFAIAAFLVNEVYFVTTMFREKKRTIIILRTVIVVLGIIDFVVFSQTGVNQYIRVGNWTTWVSNPQFWSARVIHFIYMAFGFLTALIAGIVWAKNNTLKRQRSFIRLMFIANFLLLFFSFPDTILPAMGLYGISTSGIGAAGCSLVMLYAATKLNSFDIRMGNITDKIYDFINAGVVVFDTSYRITLANPYAEGLASDSIIKGKIGDLFELEEAEQEDIFTLSLNKAYTVNCLGRDGRTYSLQMNAVLDDYGDPYCYMCIFMDITREVNLISKLEVANNAKTSFLTSMSHEIRTPINAVIGFNEIIARENDTPSVKEYTEYINRAARHLLSIINNLLDMEQITVGKLVINETHYDLSEVIRDVYSINVVKAKDKGLELKVVSAPKIPKFLYGDNVRLQQIIINLVSNAVKYTEKGSVTIEVDYWVREGEDMDLIVRVRDTGIGIKEEDSPHLFDLFERFDQDINNHIEGTGLGLALTKSLVELMGGRISVESDYGKGSCFTVTIPQKVLDYSSVGIDISGSSRSRRRYKASFAAPKARVLVVDDNEMNLRVAEGLMKPLKIQVDRVVSGYEMLDIIKAKHYDVILLDHLMPKMDGITAFKRMKKDMTHPNQDTPVIALTANAIRGMKDRFLEEGFTDYLTKPVEPGALEEMLRKYLPPELLEDPGAEPEPEPAAVSEETPGGSDGLTPELFDSVDGIDINLALTASVDMAMVKELMETFCRSAASDLSELEDFFDKGLIQGMEEGLDSYRIKVHALKNSAALVGAGHLSEMARNLEYAAADKNVDYIDRHHENFVNYYEDISASLSKIIFGSEKPEAVVMDKESFINDLDLACAAMDNFDTLFLNDYVLKLQNVEFPSSDIADPVQRMKDAIRDFDGDAFYEIVDEIKSKLEA